MISPENFRAAARASVLCIAVFGLVSMSSLLSPRFAHGEEAPIVNEKFSDLAPAIAELRQEAGQDRREIVKRNMLLLPSESTVFWPLYDQYRADMSKMGDRRVRVITDFLAKRDSMSEDEAKGLNKEYFSLEKATIEVKEKHLAKMSKVLSARTVARFFQIDGKLDAVRNMEFAVQLPLIH